MQAQQLAFLWTLVRFILQSFLFPPFFKSICPQTINICIDHQRVCVRM